MTWREYQRLQQVVEIGDRFVSYVDQGQGSPVFLIHGIPTWGYLFEGLLRELQASHRVLIPDLLGFGYSDKRDCFERSIGHQAAMIIALLDHLGLSRAHVVGHDIGGGVALRLAAMFPGQVDRLCVMNCVSYDSWPVEAMLQLGHPEVRRKLSAAKMMAMLRQALKAGFASAPEAHTLDALLAPYSTEVGKLSLIRNAAALDTNLTTEISHLLPRIPAPTLILWGEGDSFQPIRFAERLANDIPHAEFIPITDAGHFLMLDQPEAVSGHLRRFLS